MYVCVYQLQRMFSFSTKFSIKNFLRSVLLLVMFIRLTCLFFRSFVRWEFSLSMLIVLSCYSDKVKAYIESDCHTLQSVLKNKICFRFPLSQRTPPIRKRNEEDSEKWQIPPRAKWWNCVYESYWTFLFKIFELFSPFQIYYYARIFILVCIQTKDT